MDGNVIGHLRQCLGEFGNGLHTGHVVAASPGYDPDSPALRPSPATPPAPPAQLPSEPGFEPINQSGTPSSKRPDVVERVSERETEGQTWGLDRVWRWRLLAVRQVPKQQEMGDAVIHFIAMRFQRLACMANTRGAGAAIQISTGAAFALAPGSHQSNLALIT